MARGRSCLSWAMYSMPKHHNLPTGTFFLSIRIFHCFLSSHISLSTMAIWFFLPASWCLNLICFQLTNFWKFVFLPTNDGAISVFNSSGMPTSVIKTFSASVLCSSPFPGLGYTAVNDPLDMTIAPVCPLIDLVLVTYDQVPIYLPTYCHADSGDLLCIVLLSGAYMSLHQKLVSVYVKLFCVNF